MNSKKWAVWVVAGFAAACAPGERWTVGDCTKPQWGAQRLLGLTAGEVLGDSWRLSGTGFLAGTCQTFVLTFRPQGSGREVQVLATPTEVVSPCACHSRNFCLTFRDPATARDLTPAEVPEDLLRAVCLTAGERDRGVLRDTGTRNEAYRWVLVGLAVLVLAGTLRALWREVFAPGTPRTVAWVLGSLVLLAAVLRRALSEWVFLHEYFHFGSTVENHLYSDLLDFHGEMGPALYRVAEALFGLGEDSIFGTNALLATLTVPVLALLDYSLFRSWPRALVSAGILAILPHHLRVSASEDFFVPMVLFAACGLAAAVRYLETGARGPLATCVAALFLAMQSRPEGALVVGLIGLLTLARREWRARLARPTPWAAVVALGAAVGVQRVFFASGAESLVKEIDWFHPPWPQLWLDPDVTPPLLAALGVVGLVAGARSRDLVPVWLLVALEVTVYSGLIFYSGSPIYILRAQTATIPYVVLLAAGGVEALLATAKGHRPAFLVLAGVIAFVLVAGTATRIPFIQRKTPDSEVATFIAATILDLPEGPGVTLLVPEEYAPFPRELVWRQRRLIRMVGLERWARGEEPGVTCDRLLYFEYPGCFLVPSHLVTADEVNPICAAVRRACRLEPLVTKDIVIPLDYNQARFGEPPGSPPRRRDRPDVITVGFYRAVGPAEESR